MWLNNVLLLVACVLQVVLNAWQYHQGTQTRGVPTYENSKVVAAYLSSAYPNLPGRSAWFLTGCGLH